MATYECFLLKNPEEFCVTTTQRIFTPPYTLIITYITHWILTVNR